MAKQRNDQPQEHEGEKFLAIFGLENLADEPIILDNELRQRLIDNGALEADVQLKGRDFLEVCGDHAMPLLKGLEAMGADDPKRQLAIDSMRPFITKFIQPPEES